MHVVPDFTADEALRASYTTIAKSLIAAAVAEAAATVHAEYALKQRDVLRTLAAADGALAAADRNALLTRTKYAQLVPKQRTASGIVKPPKLFFDSIFTMGAADKYYNEAMKANQVKRECALAARQAREAFDNLASLQEAALVKSELEVRRHFKSDAGRVALESDPRLHELAISCAAIEAERADFKARVAAGTVADEERRDRAMAEHHHRYLDGNVRGVHCLRERDARFGALRYFTFRDREGRIWLLDFDEDLYPLTRIDFDTAFSNDRYLVSRSAADDTRVTAGASNGKHDGPDPRMGLGVDPALLAALREFVARERSGLRR